MADSSRMSLVALLVASLALSVGCGGSTDAKKESPAAAPRRQAPNVNSINVQPRDRVQDGGKLTWPINQMPANFNANQIDGNEASTGYLLGAMLLGPFHIEPDGSTRWNPDLLASDPVLVTEPKQIVTYRINPKAKWDDGKPITWEDFYWEWKAQNGTNKAYQIVGASGYEDIENVAKGADEREVVVTFKHHYADWQPIFGPLYPASTNKSPQVFNKGWEQRPLATSGPFRFDRIDNTAKTVTLVRNEKWWGNPTKLDAMVFRAMEINAQIDAIANGEIDLMDVGPDANMYNRAKALTGAELRTAGGPNFRHITLNGNGPILKDVNVRRALAMAINRTALARAMLGPLGIDPEPMNNHIFMPNQAGYQDNSGDVGQYNPDKARARLDAAGWKLDGNVRKKDGKPFEITCVIPTGVATSTQESELVQNMLAQVGIMMKINTVPNQDFFKQYVTPGQFDLTFFSWIGTPFPISGKKSIYSKPKPGADGQLQVQQNYGRIGTDEIDQLFEQATQELDKKKAIEIANHFDALIWQQVHSLPLYQRPEIWAVKKGLANMGALGMAATDGPAFQDVGWQKP